MIFRWFVPTSRESSIAVLYGAIVAQARRPAFYQSYRVPDTVNRRLEMVMLHALLVLQRLEQASAGGRKIGQQLFDLFCRDMDDSMREMGVGDLAVPRTMRRIGEAFYGRQSAYRRALAASGDDALVGLLLRHVFAGRSEHEAPARLASYTRQALHRLMEQNGFEAGQVSFPDPEQVLANA
jgi:cytochrome b pre-mRNA-processing protein 3